MSGKRHRTTRKSSSARLPPKRKTPKYAFKQVVWCYDYPETQFMITNPPDEANNEKYGIRTKWSALAKTTLYAKECDLLGAPKYHVGARVMPRNSVEDGQAHHISRARLNREHREWFYEFQNNSHRPTGESSLDEYTKPHFQKGTTVRVIRAGVVGVNIVDRKRTENKVPDWTRLRPGKYQITKITFTENGEWAYDLQREDKAGRTKKAIREISLKILTA